MDDPLTPPGDADRAATPPPSKPRYEPYARRGGGDTNYHWRTACALRQSLLNGYDAVYAMHDRIRRGEAVTERDTKAALAGMADLLACGVCGDIIPRMDTNCFVARCGHAYHKQPKECWNKAGRNCCLASCARGG